MNATSSMHKNGTIHGKEQSENIELDLERSEEFTYIYVQKSCKLLPHFNKELKVNVTS